MTANLPLHYQEQAHDNQVYVHPVLECKLMVLMIDQLLFLNSQTKEIHSPSCICGYCHMWGVTLAKRPCFVRQFGEVLIDYFEIDGGFELA